MGTAMFTAVTGLQSHQRKIDVIAANIANVNTTGYRQSSVQFQDLISQTLVGPRAPQGDFGGTNPQQVGLGVRIASIDTNFSQAALTTTGVNSDLAIQGGGFFILSDGQVPTYTRDGSFQVNAEGFLVEPATGQFVQGYIADDMGNIDVDAPVSNLRIPLGGAAIVQPTSEVNFTANLDSDTPVGDSVIRTVRAFDSLGTTRDLTLTFTKAAATNEWEWAITTTDPDVDTVTGSGTVVFNADGTIQAGDTGNVSVDFVNGAASVPTDPLDFVLDFADITQLAGDSDITVFAQDGYPRGVLESFDFGRDGVINGVFTNGLTRVIGQVGMANFSNAAGLSRTGNNQFMETVTSGTPQVGPPNTGSRGTVTGGTLENSNVDLGSEFSNLILTQRGFQANARSITTADTLLQETVNLIR